MATATAKSKSGMARFFSALNIDRYRKLASGDVKEAERNQILSDLDEEMRAFRRESGGLKVGSAGKDNEFSITPHRPLGQGSSIT